MKKIILLITCLYTVSWVYSQVENLNPKSMIAPIQKANYLSPNQNNSQYITDKPLPRTEIINGVEATYIPLGQSQNVWSVVGNARTCLWANPVINSVVFTHRMPGEWYGDNNKLAYDVSVNGGATFMDNVFVYDCLDPPSYWFGPARYPQGGIINPVGNENPDSAYYSYFTAVALGDNGVWGGYAYGSNLLTDTAPSNPTQVNLESQGEYQRFIPSAFTITQPAVAWYVDGSFLYNDTTNYEYDYTGQLILGKGEIVDGEVEYEESLLDFIAPNDIINDVKIAFAPDGLTGYICILSNSQSDPVPYTNYHPILLKTIDGGNTWSDPIHVKLGGVSGIERIKYYWSDEIIESIEFYGPGFNRDEVYYNLGYHCDIIVDGMGNPHITGIISLAAEEGWFPFEDMMATWHVYSEDGGTSWDGRALYDNIFFEGVFEGDYGDAKMYNRPYAASTFDGKFLFFSWIDTDLEGAEGNTNPNIFIVGYDSDDNYYTEVDNVTELSSYWFSAFYGSMSQYVFSSEYKYSTCEIPFVFAEFTVSGDPYSPIQYWYIDGYTYLCDPIGIDEEENSSLDLSVSQNSPNPATNTTDILVTTEKSGIIYLAITNTLGQIVHHESLNNRALAHTFYLDVSNIDPGLYVYTIRMGSQFVSKKMIIK